jgi:hypothetical protein
VSIEERLDAIEARVAALEGGYHRAPPPRPMLEFAGFQPAERVSLTIGHPDSTMEVPACPSVTADPSGRVAFALDDIRLDPGPPPERRVYRARGEFSGRVADQPVG